MTAVPSITVRTPSGVLTFTPDSAAPLTQLYKRTAVESPVIQKAIDIYLQALIARLATDIDFALESAASMFGFGIEPRLIARALDTMLMYRTGHVLNINEDILTTDSPIELIEELTNRLQALGPVPKPVPVPPPGEFVPTIGHELEEE